MQHSARLLFGFAQVEGLPKSALELAAQQAKTEGEANATAEKGPWLFTLDFPSFFPVITHSKNRSVSRRCPIMFAYGDAVHLMRM